MNDAGPLKDRFIQVRIAATLSDKIEEVAEKLHTTPSALARTLVAQYAKAYNEHGDNMPWPPQFQYYDTEPVHDPREAQKGKGERNTETRLVLPVAAEGRERYGTTTGKAGCSKQERTNPTGEHP